MGNIIFSPTFLAVSPSEIAASIEEDGFFCMESALDETWLSTLEKEAGNHSFEINKNWVSGVYAESQYYLTQMLACSKAFYQYVTHEKVFQVCDRYLGEKYRLKAMRYYETYGHHRMQWHTDNKNDSGLAQIPGLIFIAYLSDVVEGEFQYVRGSHSWSGQKAYSDYGDQFITDTHGKEIVSFKKPRGTLLIYNTYGIHRAKPVFDRNFVRKSLFFQVDTEIRSAEPLLFNPSFVDLQTFDQKKMAFFGFGLPSEYGVFPHTSLLTLQFKRLKVRTFLKWLAYRLSRTAYDLLPTRLQSSIRRSLGKQVNA